MQNTYIRADCGIEKVNPEQRVYVVCTGGSLKGFDFDKLRDEYTIAVNYAYRYVPDFNMLMALDYLFYKREYVRLKQFTGKLYSVKDYSTCIYKFLLGVKEMENGGVEGISIKRCGIAHGGNSGYAAVGLALLTGSEDIRVLGMDMSDGSKSGGNHFYESKPYEYDVLYYTLKLFDKMKQQLKPDIKITNYSANSRLEVFGKKDLSLAFE